MESLGHKGKGRLPGRELSIRVVCTSVYNAWTVYGVSRYISGMGTKKVRRDYRIFSNYLDRLELLLAPHETETAFVESALHREIMRREEEAKREQKAAA
jgi:hypothetical protein